MVLTVLIPLLQATEHTAFKYLRVVKKTRKVPNKIGAQLYAEITAGTTAQWRIWNFCKGAVPPLRFNISHSPMAAVH